AGRARRGVRGRRTVVLVRFQADGGGHSSGDGGGAGPRPARARISGARWAVRRPGRRAPGTRMSAQPQRLVSALDLGSSKVVALIAEVTGDQRETGCRILGLGMERSAGIRRGVVRDIEETTRAIDKAMKSAQRMA